MSHSLARQATMQSFFNCYLRETGKFEVIDDNSGRKDLYRPVLKDSPVGKAIRCPLPRHRLEILAPLRYRSETQRHLFAFPFRYRSLSSESWLFLDYITLVALVVKELAIERDIDDIPEDLVERVIQSCGHIQTYIQARKGDEKALYHPEFHFLDAEQSLIFGHLLHPTPKSRQGLSEREQAAYSPELKGACPLYYFRAHPSIVREDSTWDATATRLVKDELLSDPEISGEFKKTYCGDDDDSILPVHPQQAAHLLRQPRIREWINRGLLEDLGIQGRAWYATSSLRTLYHPDARFMLKGSVNIKITNSLRLNKQKEMERGVEVSRMMKTRIGEEMKQAFPDFHIIEDPAYLTLEDPEREESGFEVAIRENPFRGREGDCVTLIAGLCQDPLPGEQSRLARLITTLAKKEGRTTQEVSLDWFHRYLDRSLEPLMWLYLTYGVALEAHQQNSLVKLKEGYPHRFFYRDNQGYYYCQSTFPQLQRIFPGIDGKGETRCEDHVADERLRYYFFLNHLMGLINGFGTAGLAEEESLLEQLRQRLQRLLPHNREPSRLLESLLSDEQLPCKANLLTRLHDMDELVGPMESQSVYVRVINPIVKGVKERDLEHAGNGTRR
ncbi:IucA/IucC family protein [Paludifilum halophilum]|uniref:IucA/IucC family siderophore biosynthesis protein n=1 Tax=Paludifilum halophilum TaxID=1642702 RepID=A0A235B2J6_9BACL|nr:IucA/IucC family protein [Paludifilum halophilum]OYD06471.1 IucA/IucC family siderophore biosynthesis protein [Paludifilum halophilum]